MLSYKIYFIEYLKIIKCVLTVFKNTLPLWQVLTLPGSLSGSQGGAQTSDICLHSHTQQAAQVICQESRSRWELQDAAITQVNNRKQEATPQPTVTQKKPNETRYMGTRPATWGRDQLHGDLCFPSRGFSTLLSYPSHCLFCSDDLIYFSLRLCIGYLRHSANQRKHENDEGRIQRTLHLTTIFYHLLSGSQCIYEPIQYHEITFCPCSK